MKIHIAIIEHKHGMNVYAAKTAVKLENDIYKYVFDWWERELPHEDIPANKRDAIDLYFELVPDESLTEWPEGIVVR